MSRGVECRANEASKAMGGSQTQNGRTMWELLFEYGIDARGEPIEFDYCNRANL